MWDLMLGYFEKITLSLYKTELDPLACQFGACVPIHYAEQKINPESDFYFDGEPIEPGVDLNFFADYINDFFIDIQGNLINRNIEYIEVKPYSKHKNRVLEAFAELDRNSFIDSVTKLDNGNYDFELTEKLKQYQIIPYSIYCPGAIL